MFNSPPLFFSKNVKIGDSAVLLDGAIVEDDCELGQGCIIGAGAKLKKGAKIGAFSTVRAGSTVPEKHSIAEGSVLVEGWNGQTVTDMHIDAQVAKKEGEFIMKTAQYYAKQFAKSREQLQLEQEHFRGLGESIPEIMAKQSAWTTFTPLNPNPIKNPERKGLIYDRKQS